MAANTETDQIRAALATVPTSFPGHPRVVETRFKLGSDEAGDPAVFVVVLLDENTSDADWTSPKLEPIAERFRAALDDAGIARWPYVRFARPSDYRAAG